MAQKVLFGMGCGADYLSGTLATGVLWMPFFNLGLGLSPALLGGLLMGYQFWTAALAPILGNWSDQTRTRWGRRRPFIVGGAAVAAITFPLLYRLPEGWGETGRMVYLAVICLIYGSATSAWSAAYYALQLELTPNYDERTRLSAWMAIFSKTAQLLGGWLLALITGSWFANPTTGAPDVVRGTHAVSWFVALAIFATGALPAFIVREREGLAPLAPGPRPSIWANLRECARLGPNWRLIVFSFLLLSGSIAVSNLNVYLNIYYVNGGDLAYASVVSGWKSTAIFGFAIACVPLWTWLSERHEKHKVVIALLISSGLGHLLYFIFLQPGHPYLQLVPALFEAAAVSAIWMFLPAMRADVIDYDELQSGRRREGVINAFSSWFNRIAFSLSTGLGGVLLERTGFLASLQQQTPETLQRMKLLYILIPAALWLGSAAVIWHYSLGRDAMASIRRDLEARRGTV